MALRKLTPKERKLWEDVVHYLRINGAFVVSPPYCFDIVVEALPDTLIADKLAENHYEITGPHQRNTVRGIEPVRKFTFKIEEKN